MKTALDSSILIAALVKNDPAHAACARILAAGDLWCIPHAVCETFSTLTGKRFARPEQAARVIEATLLPRVSRFAIPPQVTEDAIQQAHRRGVRGGAIYDFLHFFAAIQFGALQVCTLNIRHFQAFWRPGDPPVVHPADA